MLSTHTPSVNLLLLRSIPIDNNLKRYYLSKYRHLCRSNGIDFANAKFKQLLNALKHYKASGSLPGIGMRKNGWMRKLINYVDTQPHFAFSFLKGLTSWTRDGEIEKTSVDFDHKLKSLSSNYPTPYFLKRWLETLDSSFKDKVMLYTISRNWSGCTFHRFCSTHSKKEWLEYWRRWYWIMKDDRRPSSNIGNRPVWPEMYKDFSDNYSRSYEQDVDRLQRLLVSRVYSEVSREIIYDGLNPDFIWDLKQGVDPTFIYGSQTHTPGWVNPRPDFVGEIHYIKKGGTGFRPIAVPNRFIQSALTPIYEKLDCYVRVLERDATYDQDKFNSWIMSRTRTDSRFIGSVDLSSATENLPLEWIRPFIKRLQLTYKEYYSWLCFVETARACWKNQNKLSQWRVGQPLGTLPSFSILSLTHHLFCESLSLKNGYGHSPYRILGDDIVISSKRLYKSYIRELENRKIPISFSKSYFGKFTEFAGFSFIRKGYPFLTPDHNIVTWESLFDFQYSTGILIPWNRLPKSICNRVTRRTKGLSLSGQALYDTAQKCIRIPRGSTQIQLSELDWQVWTDYQILSEESELDLESDLSTGITRFQNRFLITNDNRRPSGDGMFRRYIQASLPVWFKRKFRPVSTDKVFSNTIEAMKKQKVFQDFQ